MKQEPATRPELSYVLSATTADEVHKAAAWLRTARLSERVEVVMAAPGKVFGMVAGRLIPSWVRLAVADDTLDRRLIQIAGARESTGAVVIIVSCGGDLDAKLRDPFGESSSPSEGEDSSQWTDGLSIQLPPGLPARPGAAPRPSLPVPEGGPPY